MIYDIYIWYSKITFDNYRYTCHGGSICIYIVILYSSVFLSFFPARIVCVFVTFFLQGKFGDVYAAVERASRDAGTSDGRTDLGTWGTAWKCGSWVLIGLPGLVNVNKQRWKITMLLGKSTISTGPCSITNC